MRQKQGIPGLRQSKGDFSMVILLTGGVGAGKSQVLAYLKEEYKAAVIVADQVAHRLMELGEEGYGNVVEVLGPGILLADGSIDRNRLSELMFGDKKILNQVNEIIHPLVWRAIKNQILAEQKPLVVVEAALLQKEKDDIYDELWYLYTSRENRIRRLQTGRGYSAQKSQCVMEAQPSEETFRTHCQRIIDNNGTPEETKAQIRQILKDFPGEKKKSEG